MFNDILIVSNLFNVHTEFFDNISASPLNKCFISNMSSPFSDKFSKIYNQQQRLRKFDKIKIINIIRYDNIIFIW